MKHLFQWSMVNASALSVLVTVGITILLACCLKCSDCSHKDEDDLFNRH
ncbi:hypothetical protein ACOBR2_20795 [Telmatobacter bradus]|jgi:hypothetical protein